MTQKLRFIQLDVFTTTRFLGNPLAIVHLSSASTLSQSQKQLIAREFNLSETVFLHDPSSQSDSASNDSPITIDIFTIDQELSFAGHPTVGTGFYLLSLPAHATKDSITLRTKAGDIPVLRRTSASTSSLGPGATLRVPVDFKIHPPFSDTRVTSHQSRSHPGDFVSVPDVASIVKGMTFVLVHVASEAALGRLHTYTAPFEGSSAYLGEWAGFLGVYAFFVCEPEGEDGVVRLRTRMFHGTLEDPATGSAASTLAGYLAVQRGAGTWRFEIVQGVEMGRRSEIGVEVEVGEDGTVGRVVLAGGAVEVKEGWITV